MKIPSLEHRIVLEEEPRIVEVGSRIVGHQSLQIHWKVLVSNLLEMKLFSYLGEAPPAPPGPPLGIAPLGIAPLKYISMIVCLNVEQNGNYLGRAPFPPGAEPL